MQLAFLLAVFALAATPVLTDDTAELKGAETKRELATARVNSRAHDQSLCVCKDFTVGSLKFEYNLKPSHDRIGKKCLCQKVMKTIRKKWKGDVYSRKGREKRYCLKPGKAIWKGQRRLYCVETWHSVKKCTPCNPIDFIPTPL